MVTITLSEEELQLVSEAMTDFYYRKPINAKDGALKSLKEKFQALALDKKSA